MKRLAIYCYASVAWLVFFIAVASFATGENTQIVLPRWAWAFVAIIPAMVWYQADRERRRGE
jgi:hypothetical protein